MNELEFVKFNNIILFHFFLKKLLLSFLQCVPILGRGFDTGGYKCECLQGYEYPFEDAITYFDGQLVESEFLNLVANQATRYDMYKCRLAGAVANSSTWTLIFSLAAAVFVIAAFVTS